MRSLKLFPVLLAGLLVPACAAGQSVGTGENPAHVRVDGIIDGYLDIDALDRYDGQLVHAGIFGSAARKGEVVSLDIWPLFGVGVGVAGARVRLLPIELALGTLFYSPSLPRHAAADDDEDQHGHEQDEVDEEAEWHEAEVTEPHEETHKYGDPDGDEENPFED